MSQEKSDRNLEEQIWQALSWDSRVEEEALGVRVRDGIVTLFGTTSSYAKKLAAEEAAHRVPGVLDVADQVEVVVPGGRRHPDAEIANAVRATFEWDTLVPDERIQCTVADGWVTLGGSVELLREFDDAERAVFSLEGVRGVINNIEIEVQQVDPDVLRQQIVDALEHHAQQEAADLVIRVDDADVTLSGRVDSWSEKQAVLGVVRHAAGVREVHDALIIDQYGTGSRPHETGWSRGTLEDVGLTEEETP